MGWYVLDAVKAVSTICDIPEVLCVLYSKYTRYSRVQHGTMLEIVIDDVRCLGVYE